MFIPQNERRVLSVMDSQSWSYNMRAASTTVIQAAWRLRLARRKHQGHSEEARHDEHSERAKPTIGDGIRAVKALRYRWTTSNHTHAQLRMYRLIERAQHLRCRPPHYDFKLTAIQNRGANANANANAKCAFFYSQYPHLSSSHLSPPCSHSADGRPRAVRSRYARAAPRPYVRAR